jgi:hypothetical protein
MPANTAILGIEIRKPPLQIAAAAFSFGIVAVDGKFSRHKLPTPKG